MAISDQYRNCRDFFSNRDRKKVLLLAIGGIILVVIIIIIIIVATSSYIRTETTGRQALDNFPLVDGHNDLPNNLRQLRKNDLNRLQFENLLDDRQWKQCRDCHTDLNHLREGKVGAQFWVAWINCTRQYKDAVAETLEQIDLIKRLVMKYSRELQLVTHAMGIRDAFENGRIGSLIAVEGGHSIDSRLGVLRTFYELGVRYMTLTHTCSTPWADTSSVIDPVLNLTDFGKTVVLEMNRLGMMVDISHVSEGVMRDVLEVSEAPVIFSHSNSWEVYNHHRNVKDDVLRLLKRNDGIIMVNFYNSFLAPNTTNVTISHVIEHINHIVDIIGHDHIGIGADFDGIDKTPFGLEDVSKYPVLFDELYANDSNRWTITNLEKLAGRNFVRVFRKVEEIRDRKKKMHPISEWIPKGEQKPSECRNPFDVEVAEMTTTPATTTTTTTTTAAVNTAAAPINNSINA